MIEGEKNSSQEDRSKFKEAVKLRDKGKFQDALDILEQLLPKYPQKPALLVMVADMHWEIGNLEKAVDFFRSATCICPISEVVSLGLFHCLWEMGKQEEALDEVKRFMSVSYSKDYMEIVREINKRETEESQ